MKKLGQNFLCAYTEFHTKQMLGLKNNSKKKKEREIPNNCKCIPISNNAFNLNKIQEQKKYWRKTSKTSTYYLKDLAHWVHIIVGR